MTNYKSKSIVFYTTGSNKNFLEILSTKDRQYDLFIINYEPERISYKGACYEYLIEEQGYKFPTIYKAIKNFNLIGKYDYFWFCDYDILTTVSDVNNFISISKKFNINIAHPSLSIDSYYTYNFFLNDPKCSLRYVKWAEIMCPLFSRNALIKCIDTFDFTYSGWGLDLLWAKILNYKRIAIVDNIKVKHVNKVSSGDWKLPNRLRDSLIKNMPIKYKNILSEENVKELFPDYIRPQNELNLLMLLFKLKMDNKVLSEILNE